MSRCCFQVSRSRGSESASPYSSSASSSTRTPSNTASTSITDQGAAASDIVRSRDPKIYWPGTIHNSHMMSALRVWGSRNDSILRTSRANISGVKNIKILRTSYVNFPSCHQPKVLRSGAHRERWRRALGGMLRHRIRVRGRPRRPPRHPPRLSSPGKLSAVLIPQNQELVIMITSQNSQVTAIVITL